MDKAQDKAVALQQLARQNAAETEAALRDLAQWETGIKAKDRELRTLDHAASAVGLPPVRGGGSSGGGGAAHTAPKTSASAAGATAAAPLPHHQSAGQASLAARVLFFLGCSARLCAF